MPRQRTTEDTDQLLRTEWLLTNGLGGFAMGTALGVPTRRYHALLVGATTPPVGRVCALHSMVESLVLTPESNAQDDATSASVDLSNFEFAQGPGQPWVQHPRGVDHLRSCEVSHERVTWVYVIRGVRITKTIELTPGENACVVRYRVGFDPETKRPLEKTHVQLRVRPLVALHDFHQLYRRDWFGEVSQESLASANSGVIVRHREHALRVASSNAQAVFVPESQWWYNLAHRAEADRQQDCLRDVYAPGRFEWTVELVANQESELVLRARLAPASDPAACGDTQRSHSQPSAPSHADVARNSAAVANPDDRRVLEQLTAAAEAFVVQRLDPASGQHGTSIIAGYPWFSDWGRDTFISLPGLLLCMGRFAEARQTLDTFAKARKNGLIPNVFNDQTGEPEYNTADGPLWFIHAACEYVERSGDTSVLIASSGSEIGAACLDVIAHYRRGTDHHIAMDPFDKLITAGSESSQLTWMDARRDGITFTPRYGKPVEINALWCSALLRLSRLLSTVDPNMSANLRDLGQAAGRSFVTLFWNSERGCLFDCLLPPTQPGERWSARSARAGEGSGSGDEIRPNQLFALSLPHCPLSVEQQRSVLNVVEAQLLTPMGVRTLDPRDPRYRPRYEGSLFDRDAAYHQGTAWPFLLGVYAMAVLRVAEYSGSDAASPQSRAMPHASGTAAAGTKADDTRERVRRSLASILAEMDARGPFGGCPGFIAEVYDAESPQRPSGCPAQAWSVATVLQAWSMMMER